MPRVRQETRASCPGAKFRTVLAQTSKAVRCGVFVTSSTSVEVRTEWLWVLNGVSNY